MLEELNKVGPKTIKLLNNLNIYNIDDLINYYPYRYNILKLNNLESDLVVINGIIESVPVISYFGKKNKIIFNALIDNKLIKVIIYNRGFIKSRLQVGSMVTLIGKYDFKTNTMTLNDIRTNIIEDEVIEPIYHMTKGITSKQINKLINLALSKTEVIDYIPDYLVNKYNFDNKKNNVYQINNPTSSNNLDKILTRAKYEELFIFASKITLMKQSRVKEQGIKRDVSLNEVESLISSLSYTLTKDQLTSVKEIYDDLISNKRMNRLLQGDVGSGKTIVSFIAIYINYLSGYESVLMAPTEILAIQHYNNIKALFKNYNINIGLLTGKLTKKEKNNIINKLNNNELDVIIGTHALFSDDITYNNLGLIITDEQHRFGVKERTKLKDKGIMPDVLYMSATPIPRTYALTIYGDMDVSVIKTKPVSRVSVKTYIKDNSDIKEVLTKTLSELKLGHQIYVIAPLIEGEDTSRETISSLKEKYTKAFGKYYKIGVIHGKLKQNEKEVIMAKFNNHEYDILIATTVIEVGIDVKNATLITIYNSEVYGLSTIHQLRGRVGRSNLESFCFLITSSVTKRLDILETTSDGFEIAEEDFKNRGSGEIFGFRQSGNNPFKVANIITDFNIFKHAYKDATLFINNHINDYQLIKNKIITNEYIDLSKK